MKKSTILASMFYLLIVSCVSFAGVVKLKFVYPF